jgi:hypothetical protein
MDLFIVSIGLVCAVVFCLAAFAPRRSDGENESLKLERQLRPQKLSDEFEARS